MPELPVLWPLIAYNFQRLGGGGGGGAIGG
jgi:hypothetical protein